MKLKHIAQAIIHFEDALKMILPKAPEQRRNWQDSEGLQHKSRSDAIATIGRQLNLQQLSRLFCPESEDGWCWHFFRDREVIFVQPGAIRTANVVFKNA